MTGSCVSFPVFAVLAKSLTKVHSTTWHSLTRKKGYNHCLFAHTWVLCDNYLSSWSACAVRAYYAPSFWHPLPGGDADYIHIMILSSTRLALQLWLLAPLADQGFIILVSQSSLFCPCRATDAVDAHNRAPLGEIGPRLDFWERTGRHCRGTRGA